MRTALTVFVLATTCFGDEVHLRSGGKLEGLAKTEGDRVVVENLTGTMSIPASDVVRIDTNHRSAIEEYYEKSRTNAKSTEPMDHLELAIWAKDHRAHRFVGASIGRAIELGRPSTDVDPIRDLCVAAREHGLSREVEPLWRRWIELEPDSETARRALGYRNFKGVWVTPEEFEIAQGKVQFEGEWMSPEERGVILKARSLQLDERDVILKQRSLRLDERASELAAREAKIVETERMLKGSLERMEQERQALAERDRRIREREESLRNHLHCDACGFYYTGIHICTKAWFYCAGCQGYFGCGHACGRK